MNELQYLKPCNGSHSIKEAVITVFLEIPIASAHNFQKLITKEYKDIFQRFEPITKTTIDVTNEYNITKKVEEVGFEFTSFQNGEQKDVLRGFNERENERYRLSYHTLKYNRWKDFKENFQACMKYLTNVQKPLRVKSFGVYYMDEFFWQNEKLRMPMEAIFETTHNVIPTYFVESNNAMFSLAKEHFTSILTNPYLERFDIQISSMPVYPDNPSIRITHQVTQDLIDVVELPTFLEQEEYKTLLQDAHNYNKDIMKKILTKDVLSLIQLT